MIKGETKKSINIIKKFHEIKNSDSNLTDKEALKIAILEIRSS